jgi:hypothetical protein
VKKVSGVLLIVACIAVIGLLHSQASIHDETLPLAFSSYASSGSTTDMDGGPGLLLNATCAKSSTLRISSTAYSGWVIIKSYEILLGMSKYQ